MSSNQRLELLLYHGLDATGSIEVSATSSTGPWTKATLTSTKSVTDAMAEWQSIIAAALPGIGFLCYWFDDGGDIRHAFEGTTTGFWVRLSATMADLFGFSSTVLDASVSKYVETGGGLRSKCVLRGTSGSGTIGPLAISIGHTLPMDVESADFEAVGAGRATSYTYGRAVEVELQLLVPDILYADLVGCPILSGHAAFLFVDDDDSATFSESHLGGALTCYPIDEPQLEHASPDDCVVIVLRCSMEDPT